MTRTDAARSPARVAVVGGGWAGCAAAIALADAGERVTLYEAAPLLGGRARTVERDGFALDNGQHLMLGAYDATLRLVARLHPQTTPLTRRPLALSPLSPAQPDAIALHAGAGAATGLALGLLRTRGLTLAERLGMLRALAAWKHGRFTCDPAWSVDTLLASMPGKAVRGLWAPLCIAALNTPPRQASAQVFLNVLAAAFGRPHAADLVLPTGSLGAFLPDAAARVLAAAGHAVVRATTARVVDATANQVAVDTGDAVVPFDAAIVAVAPHQLARTLAVAPPPDGLDAALRAVAGYAYQSITTVYLGYCGTRVPLPGGLVRLDDSPGQWLFEREDIRLAATADAVAVDQLLAVVISTSGPHDELAQSDLVSRCDAQLRRAGHPWPRLAWSRVIAERRATYACVPGITHPPIRLAHRLYLAGDYAYPAFPATLEAAVRSGQAAAAAWGDDRTRVSP